MRFLLFMLLFYVCALRHIQVYY